MIIEALIAIAILSIAFMGLTTIIWRAGGTIRTTDFADQSVMAGQEAIEMLSVIPIDDSDLDGDTYNIERDQNTLRLRWTAINAQDVDGDGTDDFKTIAVQVLDSHGQVKMQTYYRRQIN